MSAPTILQQSPTYSIKLSQDFIIPNDTKNHDPNYIDPSLLPTTQAGFHVDPQVDVNLVMRNWLDKFANACQSCDAQAFADCFIDQGFLRDKIALTWKYRTIRGTEKLKKLAQATLHYAKTSDFRISNETAPLIQKPFEDLSCIQGHFIFNTLAGSNSGIVYLVPTSSGSCVSTYKAWVVATYLEQLHKNPELGRPDGHTCSTDTYEERRHKESNFEDADPEVIIIGGGHCGLQIAHRLKLLNVSNLVIEKNPRIGDNWRNRYSSLCLHMPHYADHITPYFEFPQTWPKYIPTDKIANWLEHYAEIFDLNVWTSSSVLQPKYDTKNRTWSVAVTKYGSVVRIFHPKQVVLCPGLNGYPNIPPQVRGQNEFNGVILHSTQFKTAKPFKGKKVLVVGTSASGFDISQDCVKHDVQVTMLQRSPSFVMSIKHGPAFSLYPDVRNKDTPSLENSDRIFNSLPIHVGEALAQRSYQEIWKKDAELLEALGKRGLKTWRGEKNTGSYTLAWTRGGGFYIDSGTCQHIINGTIKVEQGSISRFTLNHVILDDGTKLEADVVIYATGFTPAKDIVKDIMGEELANKNGDVWGLDEDGELKGVWGNTNVEKFKLLVGTFHWNRHHAKLCALQIVAEEKGLKWPTYED